MVSSQFVCFFGIGKSVETNEKNEFSIGGAPSGASNPSKSIELGWELTKLNPYPPPGGDGWVWEFTDLRPLNPDFYGLKALWFN